MSTYTPIASQTLTSASNNVTFSSIPSTYTDLFLVCNFGASSNGYGFYIYYNNDTNGGNYSNTSLRGNGSSATSTRISSTNVIYVDSVLSANTGITTNARINVMNYANTTTYKTALIRANNTDSTHSGAVATAGLWRNTSAITSISFGSFSGNLASGSTFNLYGIAAGSSKAFGGDKVATDGTYWYHTFTSSGTFTPTQSLTADYLVVAGAGGGGYEAGGGGGAGGYRHLTNQSLLSGTAYTVTVGAGGAGASSGGSAQGASGGNSGFGPTSSSGGGGGGGNYSNLAGAAGGSGGGCRSNVANTGGAGNLGGYTPVEGYAGASTTSSTGSGGGGGSGGVGQANNGGTQYGGYGGIATANSISGSLVYYAGGGGGGTNNVNPIQRGLGGGTSTTSEKGGGGDGAYHSTGATAGTANTGGGGGGGDGSGNFIGAAGGSGIVIVRYLV